MTTVFPLGGMVNNILAVIAVIGLIALIDEIIKKGDQAIIPKKVLSDRNTVLLALSVGLCILTSMSLSIFMPQYIPSLARDPII